MLVTKENIGTFLPQAPPFVLVDELVYSDEKTSRSTLKITESNIFLQQGFLLEAAMVENIAQTAAARVGYEAYLSKDPVSVGYIGAIKDLKIFDRPALNDELETTITIENQVFNVTLISGKIVCNGKVIARCEMKIFIQK